MQGTIKKVVLDKGFGFIATGCNARDAFFHRSDLIALDFDGRLTELPVTFDITTTPKGDRATNVRMGTH